MPAAVHTRTPNLRGHFRLRVKGAAAMHRGVSRQSEGRWSDGCLHMPAVKSRLQRDSSPQGLIDSILCSRSDRTSEGHRGRSLGGVLHLTKPEPLTEECNRSPLKEAVPEGMRGPARPQPLKGPARGTWCGVQRYCGLERHQLPGCAYGERRHQLGMVIVTWSSRPSCV